MDEFGTMSIHPEFKSARRGEFTNTVTYNMSQDNTGFYNMSSEHSDINLRNLTSAQTMNISNSVIFNHTSSAYLRPSTRNCISAILSSCFGGFDTIF